MDLAEEKKEAAKESDTKDDEVLIDEVDSETSPKAATEEPSTTADKDGTADADEETKEEHPPL